MNMPCTTCGQVRVLSLEGLCHECEQAEREQEIEAEDNMERNEQRWWPMLSNSDADYRDRD